MQVGAGDGAVESIGELVFGLGRGVAHEPRPRRRKPFGSTVGERACGGRDLRALHVGRLRAGRPHRRLWRFGKSQPTQRVGPEAPDPAHERPPRGKRAATPVRGVHSLHDDRHARGVLERREQAGSIVAADAGGRTAPARARQRSGSIGDVGLEALDGRPARGDTSAEQLPYVFEARPRAGRDDHDRDVVKAVFSQESRHVVAPGIDVRRRQADPTG